MVTFTHPCPGAKIGDGWGAPRPGRSHKGIDLIAASGTNLLAAANGRISFRGWNGGYGNVIYIDHGGGLSTRYAHMSAFSVNQGQSVIAGQVIGKVGSTGDSSGPHLHFEVLVNGKQVNPAPYLTGAVQVDPAFNIPSNPYELGKDIGSSIADIIDFLSNIKTGIQFFTNVKNWYRMALFFIGMMLLIIGIVKIAQNGLGGKSIKKVADKVNVKDAVDLIPAGKLKKAVG